MFLHAVLCAPHTAPCCTGLPALGGGGCQSPWSAKPVGQCSWQAARRAVQRDGGPTECPACWRRQIPPWCVPLSLPLPLRHLMHRPAGAIDVDRSGAAACAASCGALLLWTVRCARLQRGVFCCWCAGCCSHSTQQHPLTGLTPTHSFHTTCCLPLHAVWLTGQSGTVRVGRERTPVEVSIAPNPSHLEARSRSCSPAGTPRRGVLVCTDSWQHDGDDSMMVIIPVALLLMLTLLLLLLLVAAGRWSSSTWDGACRAGSAAAHWSSTG
jgi:hypothetical protein